MSPEMLDAFEFTKKLRGAVPGPHKIWCSNPQRQLSRRARTSKLNRLEDEL
jgi:hypothetical protein